MRLCPATVQACIDRLERLSPYDDPDLGTALFELRDMLAEAKQGEDERIRGLLSGPSTTPLPHPNTETHERVMAALRAMTPEQLAKTLADAGIVVGPPR
jgi:hypothetical protein